MKKWAMVILGASAMHAVAALGVVDMHYLLMESAQAKQVANALKQQFASKKQQIEQLEHQMQENIAKYRKNKLTMSVSDEKAMHEKISQEGIKLQTLQANTQQAFMKAQDEKTLALINQIKVAAKQVAEHDHLDVVLPKQVVVYSKGVDVTSDIEDQLKEG